jgi:fibronectin-binding autotransporter adhesin
MKPSAMRLCPNKLYPLKKRFSKSLRFVVFSVLFVFAATSSHGATRFWDGGSVDIAANGDGGSDGGGGTWNTTLKNWDQGSGLAHVAWVNGSDEAEINGGTQTLTLGANIILGGITQKAGGTAATISGGSGPFTLTLNITGANTFLAAANSTTGRTLNVNAVIAGATGKNLVLAGPATSGTGNITLGAANTFAGTTTFSAGATGGARVTLNNRLALQNSTVTLSADAALIFDNSVCANAFTFGGLAASGAGAGSNLALVNDSSTPIALTVGGNNSSTTYNGVLSGGGSLLKTGSGTLTLGGANTYTGSTTVSAGTLRVNGSTTSATTVNSGATLAGDGTVSGAVTVNAGGSIAPGLNNLTVSSLHFSGTATVHVENLSASTSIAPIHVNGALSVGGGAGAMTINLPTELGFNGTYRLIQFGNGPANASGFTLGTGPILAWNQTGSFQINGNFLEYVISAVGDTTPPALVSTLPLNNAASVLSAADLVATFDETIVRGTGSIELRRSSDGVLVESFNVASSARLTFSTAQLTINPTSNLPTGQTYYVLISAGAITDTAGNDYAGISSTTGWRFTVPVQPVLFTDTGSPANPLWSAILPTLNVESNDPGPVLGSVINVNNAAVETGLYGNRPLSIPSLRIHVACNTSSANLEDFTRWFQTDGNTHMLRVFVNDENTATAREGTSSHTEAFMAGGWNATDNTTYEWTARYTIARHAQGYACFQLKNTDNDWAVALNMGSDGSLTVNNRVGTDVVVTNPDGSEKNFIGGGFDVRVLDDGLNYKLWIDGVLYADSSFARPTGVTTFRWGMYFGAGNLNAPADYNVILVSGAQVQSWPGALDTATTTIIKDNNATNLENGNSWVGTANPGIYKQAVWNSTVTAANTSTLGSDQDWAGIRIVNPGGLVTINGTSTLGLDASGVNMTTATQNLVVNCPVQLVVPSNWNVTNGRTATFNGRISGYPGLTLNGAGTVQLEGANTYRGDTTVSAGTLVANDNSALSTGQLLLTGGNLSNTASATLANDVTLSANAAVNVAASQTLTLSGSLGGTGSLTKNGAGTLTLSGTNSNTGPTIVNAGTLAIAGRSAFLTISGVTLAAGSVLQPNVDGVIVRAPIALGASGTTATISAPTNAPGGLVVSTLTLDSVLSGSGNVTFSSSVAQNALSTVYLGAQSTYTGSTLLNTTASTDGTTTSGEQQIVVKLGIQNALPTTTVLTIDGGNGNGTGRFAELNLNGFNQQLAGLTNIVRSGAKAALRIQRVVNSNTSAPATLTINNSSDFTFSGILGGSATGSVAGSAMPGSTSGNNFGLTKTGAGIFTLSGANTYTGDTTVNGGTLALGASNVISSNSDITIGNATLNAATFIDNLGTLDLTSTAKINLGTGAALSFANSSAIDWTGGTLNLTGTFVSGASLRFGTTSSGLTPAQLALIAAPGFHSFALNASGYLTASVVTTFSTWIAGTFTGGATVPTNKRGPTDDADNDGISNLVEYAVSGHDPTVPNTAVGTLTFTKRPGTSGLTYAIQDSTDLGVTDQWAEVTGGSYVNNATTISYTFTPGSQSSNFLRLRVQSN